MAKILVVEDDPLLRDLLTRILMLDGYEVVVALTITGVMHAQRDLPDLIVMDIGLPILHGVRATEQIRAIPEMRTTPIIMVSDVASEEVQLASIRAGCTLFQTKPIDTTELRQNIQVLLQTTSPAHE